MDFPREIKNAINLFSTLPSIGPRAAERIVLKLVKSPHASIDALAEAVREIKQCGFCRRCFNLADAPLCAICADADRNQKIVCVVEDVLDLMAIEKKRIHAGLYHVLGGVARIGQKDNTRSLTINSLKKRVKEENIKEIIIATNPTTTGDITAVLVKDALKKYPGIKITRISRGMPTGGDIEYADPDSIAGSFLGRSEF